MQPSRLSNRPRVLIADDNWADRSILRRMLEAEHYLVEEVEDGAQALEKAIEYQPDLVLLDALMPKLDGFEACSELRSTPQLRDIPIIIITSLDDQVSIERAFELGASDYITKPIHWTVLRHRLQRLLLATHTQLELREERNLLRTLIDHLPDYIFVKDSDGRFLHSNLAHTQAAGAANGSDLRGKFAEDFFPPELAAQYDADDRAVIQSNQPLVNIERQTVGTDGTMRIVLTTKVPLQDDSGNVTGLVGISRDITERKRAEQELLRAERLHAELEQKKEVIELKERFISMVSHDFRTPMMVIQMSSELLTKYFSQHLSSDKPLKFLSNIQNQIKYMVEMLEDVLMINKAQSGKLSVELLPLELAPFCKDIVEQVQLTDTVGHQFIFAAQDIFEPVIVDANLVRRSLINLLSNAVKYSPNGGEIGFEVKAEGQEIVFKISDQGIGIPAPDQQQLFEVFSRGSNTRGINGTGLGLAIVKTSVDALGGTVTFESTEGQGTTFVVRLPAFVSHPAYRKNGH